MIWAILAALGVPLWLIAVGIGSLIFRGHRLKQRPGNIPCRIRPAGGKRWIPGHAIWVSDVFAFDGSPAVWNESLARIIEISPLQLDQGEAKKLKRLGPGAAIVTLIADNGERLSVATKAGFSRDLAGPFLSMEAAALEAKPSSTAGAD
jgi:hypothetical protein